MSQVFVSCAYRDRAVGQRVSGLLHSLGDEPVDDRNDAEGTAWWNEVVGRIETCEVFVAVVSPAYADAHACRLAAKHAAATGLPVVRLDLGDKPPTSGLHPVVRTADPVRFDPDDPRALSVLDLALDSALDESGRREETTAQAAETEAPPTPAPAPSDPFSGPPPPPPSIPPSIPPLAPPSATPVQSAEAASVPPAMPPAAPPAAPPPAPPVPSAEAPPVPPAVPPAAPPAAPPVPSAAAPSVPPPVSPAVPPAAPPAVPPAAPPAAPVATASADGAGPGFTGHELVLAAVMVVVALALVLIEGRAVLHVLGITDDETAANSGRVLGVTSGPGHATGAPASGGPSQAAAGGTGSPDGSASQAPSSDHVLALVAAAGSEDLPASSCAAGDDHVTCRDAAPNLQAVVLTPYSSQTALYDAYADAVNALSDDSAPENVGDCSGQVFEGELSWNLNLGHRYDISAGDEAAGGLDPASEAAGRIFCTESSDVIKLIWTQDPGLLVTATGQPANLAVGWWHRVHLDLACAAGGTGTGCSDEQG